MERKLAAIFSTDVKGYSRLMGDDEEATIRTLKTYRAVISGLIEQLHGRVVDSPGDNMLAEFASAVDAVKSAIAIQHELKTRNAELEEHRKMAFRIGLNVGDVITDEGRLYGDGVNIAARLEGLADPGGICISESVHMQVENKIDLSFSYQGEQSVKNIAKPVRVYKVEFDAVVTAPIGSLEQPADLPLSDKPSIAVLPFTNLSNDPEQGYFSDGLTEDIITDLSKISGLFVIARNSTFIYKGQAVDIGEVSRRLGVRHVLEGSVRKAGNRVRINVQLIDAPTGGHVWAERYDRELADIFELQDEIRQKIVVALKITLSPREQARFRRAPTENLDAYDTYLRGLEQYYRRQKDTNIQARQLFEQAIALDAGYAAAYALLGFTAYLDFAWGWSDGPESLTRALELGHQAVGLDDRFAIGHCLLGYVYLSRRQYDRALAETERAAVLDPNYADAYVTLGEVLIYVRGRAGEAIELVARGMELNPHYPPSYLWALGHAYWMTSQYEKATTTLKRLLLRNPSHLLAHAYLGVMYSESGQQEAARTEVAAVRKISPALTLTSTAWRK